MPSSPNKGYTQPAYNTEVGTWGTDLNNNFSGIVDNNLGGVYSATLASSPVTLTATQAQNLTIFLTGTLGANVTVSTPCIGFFWVVNNTTGAFTASVQANFGAGAVGSAIAVPQGTRQIFVSDTTNGVQYGAAAAGSFSYFGTLTNLASASTTDLGSVSSHNINITGVNTITSFGNSAPTSNPYYFITFAGSLTLTHNGTSLILPGAANIITAAGDTAIAEFLGSSNWRVHQYTKANGTAIASSIPITVQLFTSGSGTCTPSTGVVRWRVRMVGGGAGGGASSTNNGTAGNTTTFGSWTALGGAPGSHGSASSPIAGSLGGTGGANGTGALVIRNPGNQGGNGFGSVGISGYGGNGPWGGGGLAVVGSGAGNNGLGYGSGGSAGVSGGTSPGSGGGSGEYVEFWVSAPTPTSYTVAAPANGGAAGAQPGGNGAGGCVIVEEFYC